MLTKLNYGVIIEIRDNYNKMVGSEL